MKRIKILNDGNGHENSSVLLLKDNIKQIIDISNIRMIVSIGKIFIIYFL